MRNWFQAFAFKFKLCRYAAVEYYGGGSVYCATKVGRCAR
jgi:hypothetical protein